MPITESGQGRLRRIFARGCSSRLAWAGDVVITSIVKVGLLEAKGWGLGPMLAAKAWAL